MRLRLLYNPAAGRGKAARRAAEAAGHLRSRGAVVEMTASSGPEDMTRLAAGSSADGFDRLVVCGGDGTLSLAVRELDLARSTVALIPAGSGDDFARVLGIPREVDAACAVVFDGTVRTVDVALANGVRYLGVAGLGFDSDVTEYANRKVRLLRGSAVYVFATLRLLPSFQPYRVQVEADGKTRQEEIIFAVVGNSRQYGGGIRIVPQAIVDDGFLDYCIVHRTTKLEILKMFPLAYRGEHVRSRFVETGRGRTFRFQAEEPLAVYADGERATTTPVTFELAREKLRILTP